MHYTVHHLAAKALFDKVLHIYDTKGSKQSLDILLAVLTHDAWSSVLYNELKYNTVLYKQWNKLAMIIQSSINHCFKKPRLDQFPSFLVDGIDSQYVLLSR